MSRTRKSIRLKDYDYTQQGAYYVTVCVDGHKCVFGDVRDGEMVLNEYGKIIEHEWCKTGKIRKNVDLDEFIVMPNHIHGIINIRTGTCNVPLHDHFEKFGCSTSNSIPTIIKLFKSTTTKQINQLRNKPQKSIWQRNYYEHIIRSESEMVRIREYIINNPTGWEKDEYYVE